GPTSVVPTVRSGNFDLAVLAEGIALLTHASAHEDADGKQSRHTLRSSVWVCTETGWQMRFHQGRQLQLEALMTNRRVSDRVRSGMHTAPGESFKVLAHFWKSIPGLT